MNINQLSAEARVKLRAAVTDKIADLQLADLLQQVEAAETVETLEAMRDELDARAPSPMSIAPEEAQ